MNYRPKKSVFAELETAEDWTSYILSDARKGIAGKNFYKLFMVANDLPEIYGAPPELRAEITKKILIALKNLKD